MPNGDAMINSVPTVQQPTATTPTALPPVQKSPSKFGGVLRTIVGGALNIFAPGAGTLLGGFIRGNGGLDTSNMQAMLQQQADQSMTMLAVQNQVQTQTQSFTTVSNLLKARHDGEMSAVHNFKS